MECLMNTSAEAVELFAALMELLIAASVKLWVVSYCLSFLQTFKAFLSKKQIKSNNSNSLILFSIIEE